MRLPYVTIPTKRRLIAVLYHLAIVVTASGIAGIGEAIQLQTLSVMAGILLVGNILTFRLIPLSRYLAQRLIPWAACPGCGQGIDLVSFWECGCGFHTNRTRHVFASCPWCRKVPLWIVCPSCETSIPV